MDETTPDCEICGRPGTPSWGGAILCEDCYGTLGATCAGRPRKPLPRPGLTFPRWGAPGPEADPEGTVC